MLYAKRLIGYLIEPEDFPIIKTYVKILHNNKESHISKIINTDAPQLTKQAINRWEKSIEKRLERRLKKSLQRAIKLKYNEEYIPTPSPVPSPHRMSTEQKYS